MNQNYPDQQNRNYLPPPPLNPRMSAADRNHGSGGQPYIDLTILNQGNPSSISIPPASNVNQLPSGNSVGPAPPVFQRIKTSATPVNVSGATSINRSLFPSQQDVNVSRGTADCSSYNESDPDIVLSSVPDNIGVSLRRHERLSEPATISNRFCEESIGCSEEPLRLICDKNAHHRIERKFSNCSIIVEGNGFRIQADPDDMPSVKSEIESLIRMLTFDSECRWAYLSDASGYMLYPMQINVIIERKYQEYYLDLIDPSYKDYSISVDFNLKGANLSVQFAKIGGTHQQKSKQSNTVRMVRRQANDESNNEEVKLDYSWLWQHEYGDFRHYEKEAIYLIEQALQNFKNGNNNGNVLIHGSNGNTYDIDFNRMIQLNEKTQFGRRIKREPPLT